MDDDEGPAGYSWERDYERTWESVQETAEGLLEAAPKEDIYELRRRKRRELESQPVQRGLIRNLIIVIDASESMRSVDFKPNRLDVTVRLLTDFIREYFDQNPLSQLGIVAMKDGVAERVTDLGSTVAQHITALSELQLKGVASLQNALEIACVSLRHIPKHGTREVLVIFGNLATCDPGNIHSTIGTLRTENIRCSVIGLAAEVFVCKTLTAKTGGRYAVPLHLDHFREILSELVPPPATLAKFAEATLIAMGFPARLSSAVPRLCACHRLLKTEGFSCPRCSAQVCEVPTSCPLCSLTLVASPHLARSYHHLFPVQPFVPRTTADDSASGSAASASVQCYGCHRTCTPPVPSLTCPRCSCSFCQECDLFIHEALHNCPGCEMTARGVRRQKATMPAKKARSSAPKPESSQDTQPQQAAKASGSNAASRSGSKPTITLRIG